MFRYPSLDSWKHDVAEQGISNILTFAQQVAHS